MEIFFLQMAEQKVFHCVRHFFECKVYTCVLIHHFNQLSAITWYDPIETQTLALEVSHQCAIHPMWEIVSPNHLWLIQLCLPYVSFMVNLGGPNVDCTKDYLCLWPVTTPSLILLKSWHTLPSKKFMGWQYEIRNSNSPKMKIPSRTIFQRHKLAIISCG